MHGYAVMRTEAGSQVTWINKFSVGFFFASVFFGCLLKKNEKIKTTEMYGEFRIFNKIKKNPLDLINWPIGLIFDLNKPKNEETEIKAFLSQTTDTTNKVLP